MTKLPRTVLVGMFDRGLASCFFADDDAGRSVAMTWLDDPGPDPDRPNRRELFRMNLVDAQRLVIIPPTPARLDAYPDRVASE